MAQLLYQGHGSYRIRGERGVVVYVDPYMGEGYDIKADIVLVTHEHHDHNKLSLVSLKPDGKVFRGRDMTDGVNYAKAEHKGVGIRAVPAYNKNHSARECVGFIVEIDGVKIYASGDTSRTDFMYRLKDENIDYALLPTDGIYNMDAAEASECAAIIGAKHTVPVHTKPETLFSDAVAGRFSCKGKLVLHPGEEIELVK